MGCGSSCGTSGGSCSSGGCGKMNVHDWLSNMSIPEDQKYKIVEVRFKGGRKGYYRNVEQIPLMTGDKVVIEASPGHHVGTVSLQGELVRLQVRKRNITDIDELPVIYRLATEKDIEKLDSSQEKELPTLFKAREIIKELNLEMKLSDLEFQADATKATFFYSADERVDFRELIKRLAGEFRVRVEMRQISLRQEAGRLGGIGSCGRELCCSTWLTDFKSVATSAARYQNLSLNPSKLSGQCGRLKCCLNYELDTYLTELENIPEINHSLKTEKGEAFLQKTDIFKKMMWFGFNDDSNWHELSVERVKEIMEMNERGIRPHSLQADKNNTVDIPPMNNDLLQLDKRLNKKGDKRNPNQQRNNPKNKKTFSDRKQQQIEKEQANPENTISNPVRSKKINKSKPKKFVNNNTSEVVVVTKVEQEKPIVQTNVNLPNKNALVKRKSVTTVEGSIEETPKTDKPVIHKRKNIIKNNKK